MLRHIESLKDCNTREATASWIDQARNYFLDAFQSTWRSAGLLHYYSFLNLAKAYLVWNQNFTAIALTEISLYHGLTAALQKPSELPDFEFTIHPPISGGNRNIFSTLYEAVTHEQWPFKKTVSVKASQIMGHCLDISSELESLYNIESQIFSVQSLLRMEHSQGWFEMNVFGHKAARLKQDLSEWNLEELSSEAIKENDKMDWFMALRRPAASFHNTVLLRSPKHSVEDDGRNPPSKQESLEHLKPFAVPMAVESENWLYVSKVTLNGQELIWHPLLSDYIIAFILSTILRYHPELLNPTSKNYFLAEAWCNQSPVTALRYFLMFFTDPPLIIKTY